MSSDRCSDRLRRQATRVIVRRAASAPDSIRSIRPEGGGIIAGRNKEPQNGKTETCMPLKLKFEVAGPGGRCLENWRLAKVTKTQPVSKQHRPSVIA